MRFPGPTQLKAVASELCQRFLFTNIRIADVLSCVEEVQQLDEVE